MFDPVQKMHFVGIGGVGMCGIAEVMLNLGYSVSGSDIRDSEVLDRLRSQGAEIAIGHDASNVENVDIVVVSSAIQNTNVEIIAAHKKNIPVLHRADVLGDLMRLKHGILVCGTHGKTTTTSILSRVLHESKLDPTVIIGGRVNAIGSHARFGQGHLFLAEADESDGSFLKLIPTVAVVTNIDNDHLDHYKNFEEIVDTFKKFLEKIPFYGSICACIDDIGVQQVLPHLNKPVVTYGVNSEADISAVDVVYNAFQIAFTPVVFGKKLGRAILNMPGQYNLQNALASIAVAHVLKLNFETVRSAIEGFDGVEHRFSVLGSVERPHKIFVVDDYAHNPTKIRSVLAGIRAGTKNTKICAVFQPHRYSRLKSMLVDFASSFTDADFVIVTPIYSAGENPIQGITANSIANEIATHSKKEHAVFVVKDLFEASEQACQYAITAAKGSEVVVISLGAGDIKRVGELVLRNFQNDQK